jgi:hypothetical protein
MASRLSLLALACSCAWAAHDPADGADAPAADVAVPDVAIDPAPEADAPPDADDDRPRLTVVVLESRSRNATGEASAGAFAYVTNHAYAEMESPASVTAGPCSFHPMFLGGECRPECVAPSFCGLDSKCHERWDNRDAGRIVVTGLKVGVTLTPETQYAYYAATYDPAGPSDGDLFDAGATITATADGGPNMAGFQVSTTAVETIDTPLACPPPLAYGAPLVVTWTPSATGGRITFVMRSGNHGEQFSRVECESDDSGELVVDASLVGLYLDDWHPMDLWSLTRSRAASVDAGGAEAALSVSSTNSCGFTATSPR